MRLFSLPEKPFLLLQRHNGQAAMGCRPSFAASVRGRRGDLRVGGRGHLEPRDFATVLVRIGEARVVQTDDDTTHNAMFFKQSLRYPH